MRRPASRVTHHASRKPQPAKRPTARSGVALVITLVLLSIITFMAVTFLVVSRSQHGSVATETDLAIARLAADSATERAIADLLAPIQAGTNEFNYSLRVSTNYINPGGFVSGISSPTNVSYNYPNGAPLNLNDSLQNLANLLYDPRPPVFITNRLFANSNEFRFYLDLNHNGRYDPNGLQPVIGTDGLPMKQNGGIISNYFVGDPEWIGGLRHPEFSHSADNPFVYRYTYLAVPVGQTLDLNRIHNQALRPSKAKLDVEGGDYRRDQGVGTYEMNLAAFLYDLNTNLYAWGGQYRYDPSGGFPAAGNAFADAGALLAYRYAMNPVNASFTLASVRNLFTNGPSVFTSDGIDDYSTAAMLNASGFPQDPDNNPNCTSYPWAGADNPNHFYTTEDLFDKTKTALGLAPRTYSFTDRLITAGTNNSSYDRTTFYRLLSQLGTDSAPEPGGKMNLNYCNVNAYGYVVPNMATNFLPWQPAQFFTNAAIRLLADAGYTVGAPGSTSNLLILTNVSGILVTNLQIPIWPTNYYTPSVHRILQLAANMYDATTIRTFNQPPASVTNGFPSVFRPVFATPFSKTGVSGAIFISGYREVVTPADMSSLVGNPTPPLDPSSDPQPWKINANTMVYGIPLVVGAKKGLPNFNKLAMTTLVQVTRKLQFHRPGTSTTADVNEIDEMFVVGISNVLGVEAWNSYATTYPRSLQLVVWPDISVLITNLVTHKQLNPGLSRWPWPPSFVTKTVPLNTWPGYNQTYPLPSSFQVPLLTNLWFLSNMTYRAASDQFTNLTGAFERNPGTTNFYLPHWKLTLKPRLRFALVDIGAQRIVDYVNLADSTDLDITTALTTGGACGTSYTPDGSNGGMWCTNRMNNVIASYIPTFGIQNQIEASMGHITANWNASTHEFPAGMSVSDAITFFKGQFIPGYIRSSNTFSTPFQPFRNLYLATSWQANDPLVHYTVGDLNDLAHTNFFVDQPTSTSPDPTARLGQVNTRYEPWGGAPAGDSMSPTKTDMTVKDPLMFRSDNWDFPTNKLPNVGWLGRVHRGTPWQTVYFKSFGVTNYPNWFKNWQAWSGNGRIVTNAGQIALNLVGFNTLANDAYFSQPTNDWHLLDLFTTALNDNATRGQLSVNQTNLAAWSAALSGVIVLTNNGNSAPTWLAIQPAGVYNASDPVWPPIVRIVNGLNIARYNSNPRHVFGRLSDVLATPELTMASPFLNTNGLPSYQNNGLNDAAYERLPQQIAGLLKADSVPRFVIYAFGQTLKPESTRAIVKSGPFAGLCTNYQIVAESATRTVVRFEGVQPSWRGNPPVMTNLHPVFESSNVLPPD